MGRSGAGIVGAGPISSGGGGISRLPGSSFSSGDSYHHHHHSSSSWWYYSYGGQQRVNCNLCAIPLLFCIFVAMIIVILLSDGSTTISKGLMPCEQAIVCPSSLRNGAIKFSTSAGGTTTAYLVKKTPDISSIFNTTHYKTKNDKTHYGAYEVNEFNLVPKSVVHWHVAPSSTEYHHSFIFYLIKGEDNYVKASNGKDFAYLKMKSILDDSYDESYTVADADQYFILLAGSDYYYTSYFEANYSVDRTRYLITEDITIKSCNTGCTFQVSDKDFPPECVVVENPCNSDVENDDITLKFDLGHSGLFYCCLVFCIIGGLGLVAAIVACVVCAMRKNKGTQGQSYQSLPASTTVPPPIPAAYQQPQPTYAQPQPTYAQPQPAYAAGAPPVYADPSVPSYSYGTAPVTF